MRTRSAYRVVTQGDATGVSGVGNNRGLGDKGKPRKNIGHWNPSQQATYYIFLMNHRDNFLKKELRRTDKIFKEMAKFIKTRCPDQCRSHHQKMENKFAQFDDILNSLKQNCSPNIVTELLSQFQEQNKSSNTETTEGEICPIEEELNEGLNEVQAEKPQEPQAEEASVAACNEIVLLTFDEIIELEQAIKPEPLLADQLFSLPEVFLL